MDAVNGQIGHKWSISTKGIEEFKSHSQVDMVHARQFFFLSFRGLDNDLNSFSIIFGCWVGVSL